MRVKAKASGSIELLLMMLAGCGAGGGTPGWDAIDTAGELPPDSSPDAWPDTGPDSPADLPEAPDFVDDADCVEDVDIVFVIDVSTSMTWVLSTLRDEIAAVWSYAETISADPDYDPQFGLVVFVDDVLVTNGGAPYASAADLQAEFEDWRAFCSTEAQPGGSSCRNMDCPENTLDALAAAAEGFAWRDGAMHVVIFATDDTFKEAPNRLCSILAPSIEVQHTYPETLALLVDREIRVGVFANRTGTCLGGNAEPGFFSEWNTYPAIPIATGSQVWELPQVQSGAISMTEAIQGFVLDEYCTDFI